MTDAPETFRQVDQPLEVRAADLLGRLTDAEKIAMLHQAAPAIPRLGLKAFHTGCEALHGLAWLGRATVFPQAVGLGATWDTHLLRRIGDVTSIELRAKDAERGGGVGRNAWAPVVNTLRHPAWGRNEEGYSEDPHLTGHFATAFSQGLRGDHPRVWRAVPTLKHFLGYNNETDRSTTDSHLDLRTLHEEELAAFRAPIEAGAAGAMMLAYNRVNGHPAHTQPELVAEARSWAPGSLAVVSDAGAPTMLVTVQLAAPDRVVGAARMLVDGMDSFTDNDADPGPTIAAVTGALEAGLITMDDVEAAVLRLLELRVRSGEFDGEADPYGSLVADDLDRPAHRVLAREAAGSGVVVLRNADAVLPLADPRRIAVVGPLADAVLTDWYSGTPPYRVGIASALRERYPDAVVEVADGADEVALWSTTAQRYVTCDPTGSRVVADAAQTVPEAGFAVTDWGDGVLTLRSAASGRLLTGAYWPMRADAERVGGWVTQETFRRHVHPDGTWSLLHLGSGRWLHVMRGTGVLAAEAVERESAERFGVRTIRSGTARAAQVAGEADVTFVCVGNDPHINGRETQDRPHLWLPGAAAELWRSVRETCPHSVLTIVSSYPYVLDPSIADAGTVVWSSHGGQELGHGLVDVLSGDREPYGRLAQSWPADPAQAGDLFDYNTRRQQATYRHQPEPYAFGFGHGCTYTSIRYDGIRLDSPQVDAPVPDLRHPAFACRPDDATITAHVDVTNDGARPAEELVQVYVRPSSSLPIRGPLRLLVAYERVRLEPGESRSVALRFPLARLAVWDGMVRVAGAPDDWVHAGGLHVQRGTYTVVAGSSSEDDAVRADMVVT